MKTFVLLLLSGYQNFLSPLLHQLLGVRNLCRYEQTCSSYIKEAIMQEGLVTGIRKGIQRILSCQPFTNYATL